MVIFLNKIIFLLRVKDSLLPTNLSGEPIPVASSVSGSDGSLILETMEWLGAAELEGLWRSRTCRRLICMIITVMDPLWCQPPHLTKCQYDFNSSREAQARAVSPHFKNRTWMTSKLLVKRWRVVVKLNHVEAWSLGTELKNLIKNITWGTVERYGAFCLFFLTHRKLFTRGTCLLEGLLWPWKLRHWK